MERTVIAICAVRSGGNCEMRLTLSTVLGAPGLGTHCTATGGLAPARRMLASCRWVGFRFGFGFGLGLGLGLGLG